MEHKRKLGTGCSRVVGLWIADVERVSDRNQILLMLLAPACSIMCRLLYSGREWQLAAGDHSPLVLMF